MVFINHRISIYGIMYYLNIAVKAFEKHISCSIRQYNIMRGLTQISINNDQMQEIIIKYAT